MEIAGLSILKSQIQLQQNVSLAVMKKAMITAEQSKQALENMMVKVEGAKASNQVNQSHLGNNVDAYV